MKIHLIFSFLSLISYRMWRIETSSFVQRHCLRLYMSINTTHIGLLNSSTWAFLWHMSHVPFLGSRISIYFPPNNWPVYFSTQMPVTHVVRVNLKELFSCSLRLDWPKTTKWIRHPPHWWLVMVASLFDLLITHYLTHNDMTLIWPTNLKTISTVRLQVRVPLLYN